MHKLLSAIDESSSNVGSIFRSLDSNNDGLVSLEEMRNKLQDVLGESFTNEEINQLTNHFDDDGDGNVDLLSLFKHSKTKRIVNMMNLLVFQKRKNSHRNGKNA